MSAAIRAAFFLAPLLVINCAYADRRVEDIQLDAVSAAHFDDNSMGKLETPVLVQSSDRATRNGQRLTLKIASGKPVILTNDRSGCPSGFFNDPNCFSVMLVADLPSRNLYVVAYQSYDHGDFLLIDDQTGKRVTIYGAPRLSPDGRYVLAINNESLEGTRMAIWHRTGDSFRNEWEMPDQSQEIDSTERIRFLGWEGDRIRLDLAGEIGNDRHRPAKLVHKGKDWVFEAADPPGR